MLKQRAWVVIRSFLNSVTQTSSQLARCERLFRPTKPPLVAIAIVFSIGFAGVLSAEHFTEPDCPDENCFISLSNVLEAADTKEQFLPDGYCANSFEYPLPKFNYQQNLGMGYIVRAPPKLS